MLTGITYNIFLGQKLDPLFDWLFNKNSLKDMYCFQEYPEDKLPLLKEYLHDKKYDFAFSPGFSWRGATYGEVTLFNRNRLQLLKSETLALGGKGELTFVFLRNGLKFDVALAKTALDKTALLTQFQYGDKKIIVVNTHLVSDIHNSRKIKQVRRIIAAISDHDRAVILGDFNYPFGRGHISLLKQHGFINAFDKTITYKLFPGIYFQNDFIFGKGCKIIDISVDKVLFSDHYPVFFTIGL